MQYKLHNSERCSQNEDVDFSSFLFLFLLHAGLPSSYTDMMHTEKGPAQDICCNIYFLNEILIWKLHFISRLIFKTRQESLVISIGLQASIHRSTKLAICEVLLLNYLQPFPQLVDVQITSYNKSLIACLCAWEVKSIHFFIKYGPKNKFQQYICLSLLRSCSRTPTGANRAIMATIPIWKMNPAIQKLLYNLYSQTRKINTWKGQI